MGINKGKSICKKLKKIRKEIALRNGIDLKTSKCTNNDLCLGSCPLCEAELIFLEQELEKKTCEGKEIVVENICKDISLKTISFEESQIGITAKSIII